MLKRVLHEAAELIRSSIVFKRHLPADIGGIALYVSPACGLRYMKPRIESVDHEIIGFARRFVREGYSVWDLGANVGLFAFAAAGLVKSSGFVLGVEPDVWLANILHRSCRLLSRGQGKVQILAVAITDRVGVSDFYVAEHRRANNMMAGSPGCNKIQGDREVRRVVHVTVDWLAEYFPSPQVMKIDVEGHEAKLLRGSLKTLEKHHPLMMLEVWKENTEEVTDILHGLGYELYNATRGFDCREPVQRATWNTVALPRTEWRK